MKTKNHIRRNLNRSFNSSIRFDNSNDAISRFGDAKHAINGIRPRQFNRHVIG